MTLQQLSLNEIDSQVLILQSAVTSFTMRHSFAIIAAIQAAPAFISLKSQKKDPAKSRVKNRD
ncbi:MULTISPECIES: hypothetical protein [Pseudomonas]|uniref:hypothetical protein n=1 Tax=Pseudomonas TaxID=286 RepID=UPI0011B067C9|nr:MULTISPECIES: hypothetical protein [unclassified Pseudomonas]MCW2271059.1 hypothetical protein [Pseudomonas sp. JUb96]